MEHALIHLHSWPHSGKSVLALCDGPCKHEGLLFSWAFCGCIFCPGICESILESHLFKGEEKKKKNTPNPSNLPIIEIRKSAP